MNQAKITVLTELSRQMIDSACILFQHQLEELWQESIQAALQERKERELDYEIERNQEALTAIFQSEMKSSLQRAFQVEDQQEGCQKRSHVDFAHIELTMAVAQLEAVLKIRFNELFSVLEKRNKALFYFTKHNIYNMPFGLTHVTGILRGVFVKLPLNSENQLALLKQFIANFTDQVPKIYLEINQIYAQAGILPNLEHRLGRHQSMKVSSQKAAQKYISAVDVKVDFVLVDPLMKPLFDAVDEYSTHHDSSEMTNQVSLDQVIQAINAVKLPILAKLNLKGMQSLKSKLLEHIKNHMGIESPVFSKLTSQSMDVLGVLVETVITDKDLDDRLIKALNEMIKPLLICVIKEPELFNDEAHPVRQLLDRLLKVSSDWFGCHNLDELLVFGGMVKDGFSGDSSIFGVVNQDLSDWLTIEQERAQKGIQKFQAEAAGKDRLRVTRQVVAQYVQKYAESTSVHFVSVLFRKVMADAMSMAILRHGKGSSDWNQLKILSRDILKLTLPEEYSQSFALQEGVDITRRVCQLMMDLNFSMADILNTESNFGSFMSWLNAGQDPKLFQGKELNSIATELSKEVPFASHMDRALSAVEEKIYQQFLALPVGVVFDFLYKDDNRRRKVLCWQNKGLDDVVLCDPMGEYSELKSIKRVVSEMAEGVVVIVEPAEHGYLQLMIERSIKKLKK